MGDGTRFNTYVTRPAGAVGSFFYNGLFADGAPVDVLVNRPFYAITGLIGQTPLGDPGVIATLETSGIPFGRLAGTGLQGIQELNALNRAVRLGTPAAGAADDIVVNIGVAPRAQALLDGAPGFNITARSDGLAFRQVIAGGRPGAGTPITDALAFESIVGRIPSNANRIEITAQQAAQLEASLGLPSGRLANGGTISIVQGIAGRLPRSPVQGNSLFLGGGRGLPSGAPEINIAPINPAGGGGVRTVDVIVTPPIPRRP